MKLINILLLSSAVAVMASCNNSQAEPSTKSNDTVQSTIVNSAAAEEATREMTSTNGKVVHMNTAMFIDQIFDYKTNPTTWIYKGDKPAIIDFYADWCGPCKRVAPIMDELAKDYAGQINIYKIDTDKEKELAGQVFGIRSIPSILYIPVSGQPMMYTGAFPKERYVELINENLIKK